MYRYNPTVGKMEKYARPLVGPKGDKGDTGQKGDRGDSGQTGARGLRGLPGEDGLNGKNGKQGPKGDTGPQGIQGQKGLDGKDGKDGRNGSTIIHSTLAPVQSTGVDGDWCFNDLGEVFYKEESKWKFYRQIAGGGISRRGVIALIQEFGTGSDVAVYATQLDVVSATVTYKGEADPGTATSAAAWRIQKIVTNSEDDISITWASGTSAFDKIWDNRLVLSYS